MDNSIQAVMNDLVAADARRLSGPRFADARGAGVARRVRTRRTVRAAGVGGASVAAVGAVAVGAMSVPWGGSVVPLGLWPAGCKPTAVADVGAIWDDAAEPKAHVIDVSTEHEVETWYLYDDTLEMVVLQITPGAEGLEVTFADGTRALVNATGTGVYEFEAPGGGWVTYDPADTEHHAMWHAAAPAEASAVNVQDDVTPPFDWQWTGCGLGTPSESGSPSLSPDPTPVSKPEEVGDSPFECGFEFPSESYGTDTLSIGRATWMTSENAVAAVELDQGANAFAGLTTLTSDVASASALVMSEPSFEVNGVNIDIQTGEPSVDKTDHMVLTDSTDVGVSVGMTFVATKEGKVVATGTLPEGPHGVDAPIVFGFGAAEGSSNDIYLMDAAQALSSCDANPVDLTNVELYVVAGSVVRYYDGTVDPTIYAWLPLTSR